MFLGAGGAYAAIKVVFMIPDNVSDIILSSTGCMSYRCCAILSDMTIVNHASV